MKEIFILAILIIMLFNSFFEGFASWFLTWIEFKKSQLSVKMAAAQKEINELIPEEESSTIGFSQPEEIESEEL